MKTLVLANQKGGVGKSAVATLLSHYFAQHGRRVLAVDLDHQKNFSDPLVRSGRVVPTTFTSDEWMSGSCPAMPAGNFVLVPAGAGLLGMERQPALHNRFANGLNNHLRALDGRFDVCVIDTNPNPDIRVISALASCDFVLSPIQLNQEAMEGVGALLNHPRAGVRKIKAVLNPKLHLIGLLPTMVEATPFQQENLIGLVMKYMSLLILLSDRPGDMARLTRRAAIAEAQADGVVLWEMKKTAAREAWKDSERSIARIADIVTARETNHGAAA